MAKLPVTVTGVIEARKDLLPTLKRFREDGADAEPVILGAHRKPEAVILPYEKYQALLDQIEAHGYELLGLDPEYQSAQTVKHEARYGKNATKRAASIQWVSDYFELPMHLAAAAMEAAENEGIDGPLTFNEAKILVANDLAREKKLTIEDVLTSSGINPAIAPVIRAHAERGQMLTAKEAKELLEQYPSTTTGVTLQDMLTKRPADPVKVAAHKYRMAQQLDAYNLTDEEETQQQTTKRYALNTSSNADLVNNVIDRLTHEALETLRHRLRTELGVDETDAHEMHEVIEPTQADIAEAETELNGMGHS